MKKALRVAVLINKMYLGGAEVYARELVRLLKNEVDEAALFCFESDIPLQEGEHITTLASLAPIAYRYDVIVTNMFRMNILLRMYHLFLPFKRSKLINVIHGEYEIRGIRKIIYNLTGFLSAKSVCVSEIFLQKTKKDLLFQKLTCIDNFVDTARFVPIRRKESPVLRLLTMARLEKVKRLDVLLEACSLLKAEGIPFQLDIVGEGSCKSQLEALIATLGLDNGSVTLAGSTTEPWRFYAQADIYVCTSESETFSLSVAEAMSSGLPVVSTKCGGPQYLLGKASSYLCENGSAQDVFTKLKKLHHLPVSERTIIGKANRLRAEEYFSRHLFRRRWLTLIESLHPSKAK